MINSTMALVVSQQVSYSFGFHTFFFWWMGISSFLPSHTWWTTPQLGRILWIPWPVLKPPYYVHLFLSELPGPKECIKMSKLQQSAHVLNPWLSSFLLHPPLNLEVNQGKGSILLCMYLVFPRSNSFAVGSYFHSHFLGSSSWYLPVHYFFEVN